jgi:hypothetical protein
MANRWLAWWRIAEGAAASLSQPPIDRADADDDVYAVIAGSRLFAAADAVGAAARRAWIHSRVRRAVEHAQRQGGAGSLAGRIRLAAQCAIVAAVTVLVLLGAGTGSGRRFQTLVPLIVGALALVTARAAEPIARAWRGKQA